MKYTVAGEQFKTKKALIERIRGILYDYPDEAVLNMFDFAFMREVLNMHRSAGIKIGAGVAAIFVRRNPEYKTNRGFWILRVDGTETDFSFYECLSPSDPLKKFKTACRNAVRDMMVEFRRDNLRPDSVCPYTGEPLHPQNTHVDHEPPMTFDRIVSEFVESRGVDVRRVKLSGHRDGVIGDAFADRRFAADFLDFHNHRANLRLVSATANLSHVKLEEG